MTDLSDEAKHLAEVDKNGHVSVTDPTVPMKMTYQPTGDPAFDEKYLKWFA